LLLCPASRTENTDDHDQKSFDDMISKFKDHGQIIDADMNNIGIQRVRALKRNLKKYWQYLVNDVFWLITKIDGKIETDRKIEE